MLGSELLNHIPDLVQSNFILFDPLQEELQRNHVCSDQDVNRSNANWAAHETEKFVPGRNSKCIKRHPKFTEGDVYKRQLLEGVLLLYDNVWPHTAVHLSLIHI